MQLVEVTRKLVANLTALVVQDALCPYQRRIKRIVRKVVVLTKVQRVRASHLLELKLSCVEVVIDCLQRLVIHTRGKSLCVDVVQRLQRSVVVGLVLSPEFTHILRIP